MSGIELRQNLKLSQQLVMTPRLQLAIKMLALNNIELADMLKQEILENPILDEIGEDAKDEQGIEAENIKAINEELPVAGAMADAEDGFKEIAQYLVNYNEQFIDLSKDGDNYGNADKNYLEYRIENSFYSGKTLYEHLMEQVRTGDFSSPEILLCEYIAGNLDSKGMLAVSMQDLEDFAKSAGMAGGVKAFVGSTVNKINRLEPVGLAAENVLSSLMIQADYYFKDDDLLKDIIKNYLKEVANKNYQKICKETGKNINNILSSIENLKKLNPNPAANFSREEPKYIVPDMFLKKEEGRYVVFMDDNAIPQIRINSYYKKILSGEVAASQDMKNYAEERFKSALWLMKSIDTRKETILNIAQKIVDKQTDYFDKGIGNLKPLILKDIAGELGIHESTVSRATAGKYLSTHIGVFELKDFFTGASYGESSSENVMTRIKAIIESEKLSGKVFRDNEITDMLKRQGVIIARRTIAKYREIMNIPPSSIRNKKIEL
ncbi:MAG: RNA polymerase factor sigma-54 [bacterium]